MTPPLVLASASARRAAILRAMGARFEIRPAEAEEPRTGDPVESAMLAARAKHDAARADARNADAAVLASDTLVSCAGRVIGKPTDEAAALDTLMLLSGRVHHVYSAVAASMPGDAAPDVFVEAAAVRFRPFSREEAAAYFRVARTLDRAGAYDIDAHGDRLVERLSGARSCVMGLPAAPVRAWLLARGIPAPRPFDEAFPPRAAAPESPAPDGTEKRAEDILADAQAALQPPATSGRRLKIYYATQQAVQPPTFVMFVNEASLMHFSYERYLEGQFRKAFGFEGTPLRFILRERKKE